VQAKALRSDAFLLASFLALLTFSRIIWLYVSGHDLYGDEAQYWLWSKNIAFGYYSKPPVVAWVIHLSTSIFGDAEWAIRIASPLTHTLISIIIYFIALELFNKKTALWSAITYITLPAVFVSSGFISTDPFLMLFWALSFLAYIKAVRTDSLKWWILLGGSAGLGMLTKYSMGIFLIAVLAHLVAYRSNT
jgi:4-amino-4-deoxy-L-arabinose transferase-like glycosyltransferase